MDQNSIFLLFLVNTQCIHRFFVFFTSPWTKLDLYFFNTTFLFLLLEFYISLNVALVKYALLCKFGLYVFGFATLIWTYCPTDWIYLGSATWSLRSSGWVVLGSCSTSRSTSTSACYRSTFSSSGSAILLQQQIFSSEISSEKLSLCLNISATSTSLSWPE